MFRSNGNVMNYFYNDMRMWFKMPLKVLCGMQNSFIWNALNLNYDLNDEDLLCIYSQTITMDFTSSQWSRLNLFLDFYFNVKFIKKIRCTSYIYNVSIFYFIASKHKSLNLKKLKDLCSSLAYFILFSLKSV